MKKRSFRKALCALISVLLLCGSVPVTAAVWDNPFQDVKETDWFYPHVAQVVKEGYFAGTSSSTFSPEAKITKGMFLTALANREKVDPAQYPGSRFQDVNPDAWYAPAVQWAVSWGVATGGGDGTFTFDTPTLECFDPDAPLSRQNAAVILMDYCKNLENSTQPSKTSLDDFSDSDDVALFAQIAMEWAVETGLLSGSDGKLLPRELLTRAQAAALLCNLDRCYPKNSGAFSSIPIQVSSAEELTLGDTTYTYHIPRIQLDGVNTAALNTEIAQTYTDVFNQAVNNIAGGTPPSCSEIGYFWNVYKDVLSLVTWDYLHSFYEFHVWNVDMTTGEVLDSRQLLERTGYQVDAYTEAAELALSRSFDQWLQIRGPLTPDLEQSLRERTLLSANCGLDDWELPLDESTSIPMKGNQLFLSNHYGQLWMIGCVWHDAGSQRRPVALPLNLYSEPIVN